MGRKRRKRRVVIRYDTSGKDPNYDTGGVAPALSGRIIIGGHRRSPENRQYRDRHKVSALAHQEVEKFTDEQRRSFEWIRLHDLAEWCCPTTPSLSPAEKRRDYLNALLSLLKSALNGEFVIDGRSRLLRAHPDFDFRPEWLNNPDRAPSEAFITPDQLQAQVSVPFLYFYQPGKPEPEDQIRSVVAQSVIASSFLPRALAVRWLQSQRPPIEPPSAWQTPAVPAATRRGANPRYDWDEAWMSMAKEMHERGEFRPNEGPGWQSQADLGVLVADGLNIDDEDKRRKFRNTVKPRLRCFVDAWTAWKAKSKNGPRNDRDFLEENPHDSTWKAWNAKTTRHRGVP